MSRRKEPEWNAQNMNRKQGDTTFKQCGWCEYASSGSVRYDCYLNTNCSLLKDYGKTKETFWDTECIVKKLGKEDMQNIIKNKKYKIRENKASIKRTKKEISIIKSMKLPKKPPLPENRIQDFKLCEIVWVFCSKRKDKTFGDDKWHRGIIVKGYRSGDGCISFVLDDFPESKEGWGCGVAVPCILKGWEYEYFKTHLKEFKDWLILCDRVYNGEKLPLDKYYFAIKKGEK